MEDDDYYVDRYDCPSVMTTNLIETCSPPQSLDNLAVNNQIVDDEPYEYDDYYDQLYSATTTEDPIIDQATHMPVPNNDDNSAMSYEEYLREIWSQMDVGHHGYLTPSELYRVCEHIGMSIQSDTVIEQLFDKLDSDQDGRVSFDEFVDGLFKYVHQNDYQQQQKQQKTDDSTKEPQTLKLSSTSSSSSPFSSPTKHYTTKKSSNNINVYYTSKISPITSQSSSIPSTLVDFNNHHLSSNPVHHDQTSTSIVSTMSSVMWNLLSTYSNFLTIKCDKDGYTDSGTLIDLWESLGFNNEEQDQGEENDNDNANEDVMNNNRNKSNNSTNKSNQIGQIGEHILKSFGLSSRNDRIQVQELWFQMLEDLLVVHPHSQHHFHRDSYSHDSESYQVSLATILNEFAQLKIQNDQILAKCDRLESQLQQANCRAEFLAQEVDEQHSRLEKASQSKLALLEKKYQDQIRLIEMDFSREKEMMIIQSCHLRQDIDRRMNSVHEQLSKFRSNIKILEEENKRLETECQLMKYQNNELAKNFLDIQRQVEESDHLNAKIAELESIESAKERKNLEQLGNEMERLKEQNKKLQDQNDELLIEKESLRQQLASFALASYHNQNQASLTNQSLIFLSSPSTIMIQKEPGSQQQQNANLSTSNNCISNKRKRRRRRKKNKNKSSSSTNNNSHCQPEQCPYVKTKDKTVDVKIKSVKLNQTATTLMESEQPKTNDSLANKQSSMPPSLPEDDQSSTLSPITTQGEEFDDDDDIMDDDGYEDQNHQESSFSSFNYCWTTFQRRKRIKQPTTLKEDIDDLIQHQMEEVEEEDDDNIEDNENPQTLMNNCHHRHHVHVHSYGRSLSDEINFDLSRPVHANLDQSSSSLEYSFHLILEQMLKDCQGKQQKDSGCLNNETILKSALQQIQQALTKIQDQQQQPQKKSATAEDLSPKKQLQLTQVYFDQNNNPNSNSIQV